MTEIKNENPELIKRLTDWNADVLLKLLKQVVAKRGISGKGGWDEDPEIQIKERISDEVVDVICLPPFDKEALKYPKSADIAPQVAKELKDFVSAIAKAYRGNPYHCLQHASHTTMSAAKLISRIAVSDLESGQVLEGEVDVNFEKIGAHIHNHTYGIVSDPLTQFAVVLAGLVHTVDHRGISNEALAAENPEINEKYGGKALTEQLSLEKAWSKLMSPDFENLRRCLYADAEEKKRFRQVMVNAVMATDMSDPKAQNQRQERWETAFGPGALNEDDIHQRATRVIECLMQASEEFHTMQHWHVYIKWNERAFEEATKAYKEGRIPTDPAKTWYRDELNKFDNLVIPLTMQMKDIDAFVVSSDEYLNYALKNRQRWASNGREIVAALVAKYTTGSATAKVDLIKAISREGKGDDATTKDAAASKHLQRLVDWNNEVLEQFLKKILAKRNASGKTAIVDVATEKAVGTGVIEEIADVINFPAFDPLTSHDKLKPSCVTLSDPVASQLKEYVAFVSSKFQDNSFHCLDHASYVSMTAKKLLGRIILRASQGSAEEAHMQTFGLISDPLAQFAVVFSALIVDMDHSGVPNAQLVLEGNELAMKYGNRCVRQQNAIDLAWNQLMQPEFEDLRGAICADESELKRFRRIIVKSVIATDYTDEDLNNRRKDRWAKAFGNEKNDIDRKATIAVVLLLQAADSFHTMQHWAVYKKWNERNFHEVYSAFANGRVKDDPSMDWYKKELQFLNDHVLPLCESMKALGCFGSSADEYLAFATSNKEQWESTGPELVKSMVEKYYGKEDSKSKADRIAQRLSLSAV